MLKKSFQTLLAASVAAGLIFGAAQPADAAKKEQPKAEAQAAKNSQAELTYTYESKAFGYTIQWVSFRPVLSTRASRVRS